MAYDFLNVIQKTREYYSTHSDGLWLPEKPSWMGQYDRLNRIYDNFELLKKYGRITWGIVVQANALLFEEGEENHPLDMVFSDHPLVDESPELLDQVARELYGYKEEKPINVPEFMREAAGVLRKETDRSSVYIRLRDSGRYRFNVHMSAVLGFREHLPGRKLQERLYPIIYLPYKPEVVMILPEAFQDFYDEGSPKNYKGVGEGTKEGGDNYSSYRSDYI